MDDLSAQTIAALDIDGDGDSDLMAAGATTDGGGFAVHAFLNDGKGIFARDASSWPGTLPLLLAADLNRDERQDLIIANQGDASVSVLFVKKSGGFERPQRYRLIDPSTSLSTLDVDDDGEPDLAVGLGGWTSGVVVFRNQGEGRLGAPTNYAIGGLPSLLAVGDVNADDAPDLVLTHHEVDSVTAVLNRGTGAFAAPIVYPSHEDPVDGITLDLNADGYPDLARLGQSGGLAMPQCRLPGCGGLRRQREPQLPRHQPRERDGDSPPQRRRRRVQRHPTLRRCARHDRR